MSKTMAVHVRYIPLYISLLSSAKQELEVTIFRVVWGTRRRRLIFRIRIWNWTRPMHIHPEHVFRAIGVLNRPKQCEFRWQNINLFGTQHHRRRCSSFLWFCTCVLNLGTFRASFVPVICKTTTRNDQGLHILENISPFGIELHHFIFSLSKFLER